MRKRCELKKAWYSIKIMLVFGGTTKSEKRALLKARDNFQERLYEVDTSEVEAIDEILLRREQVDQNYDLKKIFGMLWGMMGFYIHSEILSEDGYIILTMRIQRALLGDDLTDLEARALAAAEYANDCNIYGPLTKEAFFDILAELIGMWSDLGHIRFSASFAWSLFDSLVDMSRGYPPHFRAMKSINCITKEEESAVLTKYSTAQNERALLGYWVDWVESNEGDAETIGRQVGRRAGVSFGQPGADMIQILSRYVDRNIDASKTLEEEVHSIYDQSEDAHPVRRGLSVREGDVSYDEDDDSSTLSSPSKRKATEGSLPAISAKAASNTKLGLTIASRLISKANIARRNSALTLGGKVEKPVAVMAWLKAVSKLTGVMSFSRSNTVSSVASEDDGDSVDMSEQDGLDRLLPISDEVSGLVPLASSSEINLHGKAKYTSLMDLVNDRRHANAHESLAVFMAQNGHDKLPSTSGYDLEQGSNILSAFERDSDEEDSIVSSKKHNAQRPMSPGKAKGTIRSIFCADTSRIHSAPILREDQKSSYKYVLDQYDNDTISDSPQYPMPLYRFPAGKSITTGSKMSSLTSLQTSSLMDLSTTFSPQSSLLHGLTAPPSQEMSPIGSPTADFSVAEEESSFLGSWRKVVDPAGTSYDQVHDQCSLGSGSVMSADRSVKRVTFEPRPRTTGSVAMDTFYTGVVKRDIKQKEITERAVLSTGLAPLHTRQIKKKKKSGRSRSPPRVRISTAPDMLNPPSDTSLAALSWSEGGQFSMDDSSVFSRDLMGLESAGSLTDSMILRDMEFSQTMLNASANPSSRAESPSLSIPSVGRPSEPSPKRSDIPNYEKLPSYMRPKGKLKPVTIEGVRKHYKMVTYHTDGVNDAVPVVSSSQNSVGEVDIMAEKSRLGLLF